MRSKNLTCLVAFLLSLPFAGWAFIEMPFPGHTHGLFKHLVLCWVAVALSLFASRTSRGRTAKVIYVLPLVFTFGTPTYDFFWVGGFPATEIPGLVIGTLWVGSVGWLGGLLLMAVLRLVSPDGAMREGVWAKITTIATIVCAVVGIPIVLFLFLRQGA